jgi:hypothetical protein
MATKTTLDIEDKEQEMELESVSDYCCEPSDTAEGEKKTAAARASTWEQCWWELELGTSTRKEQGHLRVHRTLQRREHE